MIPEFIQRWESFCFLGKSFSTDRWWDETHILFLVCNHNNNTYSKNNISSAVSLSVTLNTQKQHHILGLTCTWPVQTCSHKHAHTKAKTQLPPLVVSLAQSNLTWDDSIINHSISSTVSKIQTKKAGCISFRNKTYLICIR